MLIVYKPSNTDVVLADLIRAAIEAHKARLNSQLANRVRAARSVA